MISSGKAKFFNSSEFNLKQTNNIIIKIMKFSINIYEKLLN